MTINFEKWECILVMLLRRQLNIFKEASWNFPLRCVAREQPVDVVHYEAPRMHDKPRINYCDNDIWRGYISRNTHHTRLVISK